MSEDSKREVLLDLMDDVIDKVRQNRSEQYDIIEMLKEIERLL